MKLINKRGNAQTLEEIEKLIYSIKQMVGLTMLAPLRISVQGKHPVTNGLSVVEYDADYIKNLHQAKELINNILFGLDFPGKTDFIVRIEKKVVGGYACGISISGVDKDGDRLDFDFKIKQEPFMQILKYGLFQKEKINHNKYILTDGYNYKTLTEKL